MTEALEPLVPFAFFFSFSFFFWWLVHDLAKSVRFAPERQSTMSLTLVSFCLDVLIYNLETLVSAPFVSDLSVYHIFFFLFFCFLLYLIPTLLSALVPHT